MSAECGRDTPDIHPWSDPEENSGFHQCLRLFWTLVKEGADRFVARIKRPTLAISSQAWKPSAACQDAVSVDFRRAPCLTSSLIAPVPFRGNMSSDITIHTFCLSCMVGERAKSLDQLTAGPPRVFRLTTALLFLVLTVIDALLLWGGRARESTYYILHTTYTMRTSRSSAHNPPPCRT